LLGISWGIWGGAARVFAVGLGGIIFVVAVLPHEMELFNRVLFLLNPVAIGFGYFAARPLGLHHAKRMVIVSTSIVIISMLLIRGIEGVPGLQPVNPQDIGGLMLNLLLALFGISMSMPIGIGLALGRQSNLPVVKVACVVFIEVIRGVPLITLLFMSRHILPLTFPSHINVSALYLAAITITLFSSAYMAENVRGGMAAVSPGQTEAARALGLRGWQTTLLITLPQGLRNIIPAIVGQFISLFKDTSLVFFIGMLDLVEMGRSALQDSSLEFIDNGREVYLFIAVVFWVFCFSMSYVSRRIEGALGVGRR
ncbi:MAG: amino acid ABC transporter permease, partial [Chloroflexi bacterium]|nr:amino acid ABC transporter permease [Chloroflexota bacterium]